MNWQFPPFAVAFIIDAAFAVVFAITAWRRRATPGGVPFALLMLAIADWSFARALEAGAVGIPAKVFWAKVEYLGIASAAALWLLFALEYARRNTWLTRRNMALLWVVPAVTVGMAATNEQHGLLWSSIAPSPGSEGTILIYSHGAWFWIAAAFSYLAMLTGAFILLYAVIRSPRFYRRQVGALVLGTAIPLAGNVVYLAGLSPVPGLDLTPFAFTLTGFIYSLSIFQFRLFDIVPVARDAIIEIMSDGVLVLDAQSRVVDINPAAQRWIGASSSPIGQRADVVLAAWAELVTHFRDVLETRAEIAVGGDPPRCIDLRISPLYDRRRRFTGRLIVFREITERKRTETELHEANERLQSQLAEIEVLQISLREQATRDSLTGLFNRRYLEETLERELSRAAREAASVSLVMVDIDHFKGVNDVFGHDAGDAMLRALSDLLRAQIRQGDIACRYGGDEFVIVLPGAPLQIAYRRAEQWREAFQSLRVEYEDVELHATLSCGIAAFPSHSRTGDELLHVADKALYTAKAEGRNRAIVWAP